jgi:hypothetical protein
MVWLILSTKELETALAQGQLDERKAATAKEILSRRWQSKSEKIKGSYGWLGHVAAAVALSPPLGFPERRSSYCVGATGRGSAFENRT